MGSGKSGGSASESKNVYGTLGGGISWGPLGWLRAVIHNGNYLWQGTLALTEDVTDLTGSILDPSYVKPGGYLKLYLGTETQPADPALPGHPPMLGTAWLMTNGIFFGQDTGSGPNLQVIVGRLPVVPTSIVAAEDNFADDDQINPIAALAEILLDERGGGLTVADLDGPSWLAAAHWCAQDQEHRDFTFCSPLITEQLALRELVKQLIGPFNGFCRWTSTGKLACHVYEWGSDPGGLPVLDANAFNKPPKLPSGDWDDVPTEMLVKFVDRAFEFQDNTTLVPNARAAQIRQVDDQKSLDRKHVTRFAQAHRQGVEYNRRIGTAPASAPLTLREPLTAALAVGDKIKINVNPEPAGAGLAQLVRIERIERDRSDEATITVMTDNLVPASAYRPSWVPPAPVDEVSPPLEHFLGVPLPANAFGWPPSVAILATRPAKKIDGFTVYFSNDTGGAFAVLGQQAGFAVRAALQADVDEAATVLAFTELDGLDGPDAGLAAHTPGGNVTAAADNVLLALIAEIDGDGRIALGADGDPLMEFVSVVDREPDGGLPAATYNYTVLRGRLGTMARGWSASAVVWIVPHVNLTAWRHSLLSSMLGGVAYFRMVSFTRRAEDDTIPVPELSVNMLPATAPSYGGNIDGTTDPDDGPPPNPVTGVTVSSGIEELILRWTNPNNVPLRRIFIYENTVASLPAAPSFFVDSPQNFFFRRSLPDGATRYYWLQVQSQSGRRNVPAGPFSGTVVTWPVISGLSADLADVAAEWVAKIEYNSGGQPRLAGFRVTAFGGGDAAGTSEIVLQADKVGIVNEDGDNQVAPFAVVGGNVYLDTAIIRNATISSAMISDLLADKVTAGTLTAMTLKAGKMATDFAMFNDASPGNTFASVAFQNNQHSGPTAALGAGGTEFWLITYYGWGHTSGGYQSRFGKADMNFVLFENGGSTVAPGSFVDLEIICRLNGVSISTVTPFAQRATDGNGSLNVVGGVNITGLTGTDEVEFGVRAKSPDAGSTLNVADLTGIALNF